MENVASRFGQRLAHTEKKYRDQALKKLTTYLSTRAQWSALEWDKLWKALFYCMWMSDKRAVQDELSTNLAALVHRVPQVDDALGFVHSFFRTMHREWHGIDGLRLDKFYSLIRKFVHQTLLLLRNHEWDRALVDRVVSIFSSEIMSQLPNGLRLHMTDLFLTELHGAAGDDVDTETFLLLLEPFFTLLSSEYDKTVFKRVRELVFLPMLTTYKFGPQPPAKKKQPKRENGEHETDGEDEEDEEEEPKVFTEVELPFVQHRIFAIASADDTAERNRSVLYELYSHFFKVTKIDSLKANQDGSLKPKPKSKKRKQPATETEPEAEAAAEDESSKKKKKNKRRKKNKQGEDDNGDAAMDEPEVETPVAEAVTPEKKAKKDKKAKQEEAATPVNTPVKSNSVDETPTKKQKKAKAAAEAVVAEAAKALEVSESSKKSKKDKKDKKEVDVEMEEPVVADETPSKKAKKEKKKKAEEKEEVAVPVAELPAKKSKKDKKKADKEAAKKQIEAEVAAALEAAAQAKQQKKDKKQKQAAEEAEAAKKEKKKTEEAAKEAKPEVVVRSGMKFRRCGGCGGIGKGLVPAGKDCCRHCERTGQLKKKALAADKKKRKAEALAAKEEEDDASAPSKKVTFGKNRALAHELSVKRLKASKAVVKELTSDIKGVLKAGSSPVAATKTKSKKAGGRMKAADFF